MTPFDVMARVVAVVSTVWAVLFAVWLLRARRKNIRLESENMRMRRYLHRFGLSMPMAGTAGDLLAIIEAERPAGVSTERVLRALLERAAMDNGGKRA